MIVSGLMQTLLIFGVITAVVGVTVYVRTKKLNPYLIAGVVLIAIGMGVSLFSANKESKNVDSPTIESSTGDVNYEYE